MKKRDRLPNHIYVQWADDPNVDESRWLTASETIEEAEDGQIVGVYVLQETKRVKVSRSFEKAK